MYRSLVLVLFLQCFLLVTANVFPILDQFSSDCQNDLRLYRTNYVNGINRNLSSTQTIQCLNTTSITKGNKFEATCPSNKMIDERDSCNNYTGEFCRINIASSNESLSVDFSLFLCLPKSCAKNSSDIKLLGNFSSPSNLVTFLSLPKLDFPLDNHLSRFSFDSSSSVCSLYNNTQLIASGPCLVKIKCGGMSSGLIILTVFLVLATIFVGVLVVVMFYQKRKAGEEMYSEVPNNAEEYS